jgi:hypothetical protein
MLYDGGGDYNPFWDTRLGRFITWITTPITYSLGWLVGKWLGRGL